jgi:hypothetical protein
MGQMEAFRAAGSEVRMKLHFWTGVGAAKAASPKASDPKDRRQHFLSIAFGVLLALLIGVGLFILMPISITVR